MANVWVESLERGFERALDLLSDAVRDCPGELWETSMWIVAEPGDDHEFLSPDWSPVAPGEHRDELARRWVERWGTPWSVAWHALETLDYDVGGGFGAWAPPPPFAGHPHWRDLASLPAAWSRAELMDYTDSCRQRVRDTLATMTDELAARPLPAAHRYRGEPYALVITGLIGHTTEHASQIRQFISPRS